MPEMASLWVRLGVSGDSQVQASLARTKRALKEAGDAGEQAATALRGFGRVSLFEAAFAAQSLVGNIQALTAALGAVTGVTQAAQFQKVQFGLEALTGSTEKAARLLREIKGLGASTPFETAEIARFAQQMLASGFAAEGLAKNIKAVTDTVTVLGGNTQTVERMLLAIRQIRGSRRLQGDELNQLLDAGLPLQRVVGAATGRSVSAAEARGILSEKTGEEAAELLLRGMEKAFGGKARLGFLDTLTNLFDTLNNIMEPTGRLINTVLAPAAVVVGKVLEQFQRINEFTGGLAGLFVLFRVGVAIFPLLAGGARAAWAEFARLTAALYASAGAARVSAASQGVSGLGALFGGIGGLKGGLKGLGGALRGPLGMGALGIGLGIGADFVGNKVGGWVGDLIKNVGTGASLGMLFGPKGAIVGAIGGALKTAYDYTLGGAGKSAQDSENLKKSADALQDIKAAITGGGARSRRAVSRIEVEFAFAKALATGIG